MPLLALPFTALVPLLSSAAREEDELNRRRGARWLRLLVACCASLLPAARAVRFAPLTLPQPRSKMLLVGALGLAPRMGGHHCTHHRRHPLAVVLAPLPQIEEAIHILLLPHLAAVPLATQWREGAVACGTSRTSTSRGCRA